MLVTTLEVENFCKITALNVRLNAGVTEISGDNGAGKSSTLNALWVLLKGKRVAPPEPIRRGAERCRIRGQIGEYIITRTFKRTKDGELTTELRIERGDEAMPPTESFMKSLIGEHMLDPGDFIKLSGADKFNVFTSFVPGVDFKRLANQTRQDYERRTEVNRVAKDARSAAALLEVPSDTPEVLEDEKALTDELARAAETNADIERRRQNREKAQETITHLRAIVAGVDTATEQAREKVCARRDSEVGRLEEQLRTIERQITAVQTEFARAVEEESTRLRAEASHAAGEADALQERLESAGPLPELVDVESLRKRIDYARLVNENVRKRKMREKHLKAAEQYEGESSELTARMEQREHAKQEAIAKAQLPIAGLTFGDGEVFLNGVPFEQASSALQIKCGVAIAVAKNPTLRLVWIRDASLLDDKSYATVEQLAKEFGCQILLETVRPITSDAIVLEDGHAKQAAREDAA